MLDAVCDGIREALGLREGDGVPRRPPRRHARAAVGRRLHGRAGRGVPACRRSTCCRRCSTPRFVRHGCVLMERDEAERRTPPELHDLYTSVNNGRGPRAWSHHWLVVPLHDRDGRLAGLVWVDDPDDRLLPSDESLQALRAFANQAMSAIESARQLDSLRHLAAHDPLTGLRNRRGFEQGIDAHLDALGSGGELSLLVLDLDHFKRVNDSLGHDAGDDVLRRFADVLRTAAGASRRADAAGRRGVRARAPGRRRGAGAGRRRAPAAAAVRDPVRRLPVPGLGVRRGRQPRRRRRETPPSSCAPPTARSTPPSASAATAASSTTPRRSRCSTRCATRRAPAPSSSPPRCCWPRRSTCATSPPRATPRRSGRYAEQIARELQFEVARVERIRAAGDPARHRQARDRRRGPAQAGRAGRRTSGSR